MSIHKDNKRNTYYIRIRVDGRNICRRGFKTKKEAKIYESLLLDKRDHHEYINNISFNYLINTFLVYRKNRIKASSYVGDVYKINTHIIPYFSKFDDISAISSDDIIHWQDSLYNKFSENYLNTLYTLLKCIFKFASGTYNIPNPTILVDSFKKPDELKKEMNYFTLEEFNLFISKVKQPTYKLLFEFLFYTGTRIGEALALNWNDFNTNFTSVRIKKTLSNKIVGKKYVILPPKSKNAIRTISLPDILSIGLKNAYQDAKKIDGFNRSCFAFGFIEPLKNTTIKRIKDKACEEADLKSIRLHDFRHSHATYLINNGADMLAVSKRLGHSSIAITIDTYTHLMKNKEDELMNILNKK